MLGCNCMSIKHFPRSPLNPQQPTSFRIETYELLTVFETPELITSLAEYSESRRPKALEHGDQQSGVAATPVTSKSELDRLSSVLFLQVLAAADYFTMNRTLMEHVPPVFVDIILDPYILNFFPRSLIPTASYIIILAIGSWLLSQYILKRVVVMASEDLELEKKTK
jgi:hypothetical protein